MNISKAAPAENRQTANQTPVQMQGAASVTPRPQVSQPFVRPMQPASIPQPRPFVNPQAMAPQVQPAVQQPTPVEPSVEAEAPTTSRTFFRSDSSVRSTVEPKSLKIPEFLQKK
jgi:cell division protein FtsZ